MSSGSVLKHVGQREGANVARIIAVANQKGGVGKTTTVVSLATALAELGERVLAVDLDPQAGLTFSLGLDPEDLARSINEVLGGQRSAAEVIVATDDGVWLLPATLDLASAEAQLFAMTLGREHVLRQALAKIAESYDTILLDCSPSLGIVTINALTAADDVLIPLQCETLSHRGVGQLLQTVDMVRELTNPKLRVLGVLPTLYDGRTLHARSVLTNINAAYDIAVLEPPIARSIRFAEAPAVGRSALAMTDELPGVRAYREHARRIHVGEL
jgi:chromosome partitioning protein